MTPPNNAEILAQLSGRQSTPEYFKVKNALDGKIIATSNEQNINISIWEKNVSINIPKKHHKFIEQLARALIVERWVCEARISLLKECKAKVADRWFTWTYGWPDLYFSERLVSQNVPIAPFESMLSVFWEKPRWDLEKLVTFVNSVPEEYIIPKNIVEDGAWYPRSTASR